MAYSKIIIAFNNQPPLNSEFNFKESKVNQQFYEIFKKTRTKKNETTTSLAPPDAGGYWQAIYYKDALTLDYNMSGSFFIKTILDNVGSGGTVVIEATYPGAIFSVVRNSALIDIEIINIEDQTPPEPEPEPEPEPNSVTPDSLIYDVLTDIPTTAGKILTIVTKETWSIISEVPAWLNVSKNLGSGNDVIQVTPHNYSLLSVGQHSNLMKIKIGSEIFNVNIVLNVFNAIINPYLPGQPAFTLDPKYFVINSSTVDTYFQFNSTITIYNFFTNNVETRMIPQKALPFKGKSEVNVGQLIHRLMDNFNTVNSNIYQYKLSKLNIECKEIKLSDDSIVSTVILPEINFVAGLSKGFSVYGFLEFNKKPTRVTNQGFYFLNLLIPSGSYELQTFKNGQLIKTFPLPNDSVGPLCYKVFFNSYIQGDFIEYVIVRVGQSDDNPPKKAFHVFPSQFFSNMITWENEFLLQSTFEFTHDHDIKSEIERQSSKTFNKLVEKTTHYSVSKENKLTINTGWVSKNDIDSIESLMLSKRAFININDKIVDLVPFNKTLTNFNSKEELFDFTFEFIINRTHNEETYTF